MIEIRFLGTTLNAQEEHELLSSDYECVRHGFDAIIEYSTPYCDHICKEKRFNLTEIHYLYNKEHNSGYKQQVAFESDIHFTGCVRYISEIRSIDIVKAKVKHKSHQQSFPIKFK